MIRRRLLLATSALVCIGAAALCAVLSLAWGNLFAATPKLALESTVLDLGVLEAGKHEFRLPVTNAGGGLLRIEQIRSSCRCTDIELCEPVPAGATGVIRGTVSVGSGARSARLLLVANDPQREHVAEVTWFPKTAPVVVPSRLAVRLKPRELFRRELRVVYAAGSVLEFNGISGAEHEFTCEVVGEGPTSGSQQVPISREVRTSTLMLALNMTAPQKPGQYVVNPVLHFTQEGVEHEVRLSLALEVVGKIWTRPQQIFLGADTREHLIDRSSRVRVFSDCPPDLLSVLSQPEYLECTLHPISGQQSELEIKVISSPPPDSHDFSIVLKEPSGESMAIPGTLIYAPSKPD